jgi:ethanolamine kinase
MIKAPHYDVNIARSDEDYENDEMADNVQHIKKVAILLHSHWISENISILTVQGGITNRLYKVSFKDEHLLIRIYGDNTEILINRERDNDVFQQLSNIGFGIKLYATFNNGRIEEYIDCTTLSVDDMCNVVLSRAIATKLCELHSLPIKQTIFKKKVIEEKKSFLNSTSTSGSADTVTASTPCFSSSSCRISSSSSTPPPILWEKLYKWHGIASHLEFTDASTNAKVQALNLPQIKAELDKLKVLLDSTPSPVVFSHNDLLNGNILLPTSSSNSRSSSLEPSTSDDTGNNHNSTFNKSSTNIIDTSRSTPQIVIVDMEYGGFNYRGFDIGNHFCEYAGFDYTLFSTNYPNKAAQYNFFKAYLKASRNGDRVTDAELDMMYIEVNRYALASHMFWGIWSVIQAKYSVIDFDYIKYAHQRFSAYYSVRDKWM